MLKGRTAVYYPVLDIPAGRSGKLEVRKETRPAGHEFALATMRGRMFGQRSRPPVSWPHETTWHSLVDDENGVWMTDLPVEQRQHDEALRRMTGDVLVGGLGLGYAATVLAAKRAVSSVTVVERSADVARLVWPHLGPAVDRKGTLVLGDLFEHLRGTKNRYRYGFFDIWQMDGETTFHETVVPLRRLAHGKVGHVACWNEDVMRGQLAMGLLTRLMMLDLSETPGAMRELLDEQAKLSPLGRVTLGKLSTARDPDEPGACYTNWAVPFWRWYGRTRPDLPTARTAAGLYAQSYGIPSAAAWMRDMFGPSTEAA